MKLRVTLATLSCDSCTRLARVDESRWELTTTLIRVNSYRLSSSFGRGLVCSTWKFSDVTEGVKSLTGITDQCSRLTFQLSSLVASARFDFTSQNKFSLARLFLHHIVLCSICVILSRVKSVNVPLCNLKSAELGCWPLFPTVKDPHTNTKCKFAGTMLFTPLFSISVIMTNFWKVYLIWACHSTGKRREDVVLVWHLFCPLLLNVSAY